MDWAYIKKYGFSIFTVIIAIGTIIFAALRSRWGVFSFEYGLCETQFHFYCLIGAAQVQDLVWISITFCATLLAVYTFHRYYKTIPLNKLFLIPWLSTAIMRSFHEVFWLISYQGGHYARGIGTDLHLIGTSVGNWLITESLSWISYGCTAIGVVAIIILVLDLMSIQKDIIRYQ